MRPGRENLIFILSYEKSSKGSEILTINSIKLGSNY